MITVDRGSYWQHMHKLNTLTYNHNDEDIRGYKDKTDTKLRKNTYKNYQNTIHTENHRLQANIQNDRQEKKYGK